MMIKRCWLLCICLWVVSLHGQTRRADSIRTILSLTPDSLQAPVLADLAHALFWSPEPPDTRRDSAYELAVQAELLALTQGDTLAIKDALWVRYSYLNLKANQDSTLRDSADQIYDRRLWYLSVYGYDSSPTFTNSWNDLEGIKGDQLRITLRVFSDSTASYTLEDILQLEVEEFAKNELFYDELADSSLAHWARLRIRGNPDEDQEQFYMVGWITNTWKDIDIYIPKADSGYTRLASGSRLPLNEKAYPDHRSMFEVYVPQNSDQVIYIRVKNPNTITRPYNMSVYHVDKEFLEEYKDRTRHSNGIFLGILAMQMVYFLLLFFSVRDKTYLYFVIYLLGPLLMVLVGSYFTKVFPQLGEYEIPLLILPAWVAVFGFLKFIDSYLNLRELLPKWRKGIVIFQILYGLVGLSIIVLYITANTVAKYLDDSLNEIFNVLTTTYIFMITLCLIMVMILSFIALRKGYTPAKYLIIANIFLILGVGFPAVIGAFDIDLGSFDFQRAMRTAEVGIVLQLSFFALGVGHKQKLLQDEKESALEESLQMEHTANEKLRQADKMKDDFLANTSHELRTPLNGIIGIAEGLHAGAGMESEDTLKENLSVIINAGKRLNNLVNDLLDFSKLQNYDIQLQHKALDLRSLTDVVLAVSTTLLKGKPVDLHNDIPEELEMVWADENRLQQILFNLIGNAIKFTEQGEVRVKAVEVGESIRISVTDTGIGIPKEKQQIIFENFQQGDGSISRAYGGTGLGLSITRQLVELHGGTIGVESIPGEGSTFSFTLPLARNATEAATPTHWLTGSESEMEESFPQIPLAVSIDAAPQQTETIAGSPMKAIVGQNKMIHILVVDDESINQQVMRNLLSLEKYFVTTVMNGEEALQAIERGDQFDLVLLDVMMPRMSGFEVCQKIRERFLPNELPIIMVTAKNQVEDLVTGLSFGANDYISKPFSREELLARIKTHLNLFNINTAYSRFVPQEFIRTLGHDSIMDVKLGDGVELEFTVFFADIRSYTTLAEEMTPKENFNFLNAYLGRVGPIIKHHKGFVAQYYGDGVMALFPEKPEHAVVASIELQRKLRDYNVDRISKGRKPVKTGMGMHTGPLLMGIIGDERRFDAGVVSDTVNTAARMEGLTKYYGSSILISGDSFHKLIAPEQFQYRFLGKVLVKGKKEPVEIYDFFEGDAEEIRQIKLGTLEDFSAGLEAYFDQAFDTALHHFQQVLELYPEDLAAKLYENHCQRYLQEGVPDAWSGVELMLSK